MPSRNEITGYVNYLADHIQEILPQNRAYARRVLRLLMGRIGFRPDWRQVVASAAVAVVATIYAMDWMDDATGQPYARIVKALDGMYYVVIYHEPPGKALKVLQRTLISPEEAAERLKSRGWERVALASFGRT
jgi:anti-sigma-K factor RskA